MQAVTKWVGLDGSGDRRSGSVMVVWKFRPPLPEVLHVS